MSENKLHRYFEGFGRDYTQCAQSLILTLKSRITSSSNKGCLCSTQVGHSCLTLGTIFQVP